MIFRFFHLRNRGLATRILILTAVVAAALLIVGVISAYMWGIIYLASAVLAAASCLLGGILALVAADAFRTPRGALMALWLGMAARTLIPLGVWFTLHLLGLLANAGLLCYVLVFYAIVLGVGTALALPSGTRPCPPKRFTNEPNAHEVR
jgi:hypothetical protein